MLRVYPRRLFIPIVDYRYERPMQAQPFIQPLCLLQLPCSAAQYQKDPITRF